MQNDRTSDGATVPHLNGEHRTLIVIWHRAPVAVAQGNVEGSGVTPFRISHSSQGCAEFAHKPVANETERFELGVGGAVAGGV